MAVLTPLCDPPGVTTFNYSLPNVAMLLLSGLAAFLVSTQSAPLLHSCQQFHFLTGMKSQTA
jgi:hypothetical protein